MRVIHARLSFLFMALVLASCENSTEAPTAPRPSFSSIAATGCPAHATFIATDAASLVSAVAAAHPNDTIAVSGTVTDPGIFVFTDDLTFTCAIPGSGLRADPQTTGWLFVLLGKHETIEHLTLDAGNTLNGAVVAFNGVEGPYNGAAEDIQLLGDEIRCAGQHEEPCLSIRNHAAGVAGVVVAGSSITDNASLATVELDGVNNVRIEGSTIAGGVSLGGLDHDIQFVTDHFVCSGQRFDTCLSIVSDAGVRRLLISGNTFESDASLGTIVLYGTDDVRVEDNTLAERGGIFGFVLFEFGNDVRLARNHFLCRRAVECVHMESDLGGIQRTLIAGNTFDMDNQLAILLVGVNDGRVEKNTFAGILSAGGTGDPVIFITVSKGRITDNSGECGDACVFGAGDSPGLVLSRNQFKTAGSSAGFLLQESTDGDSVVGNTLVTTKPSFVPEFGGIRIRDGANAVVRDNIVTGPWANSLALTDVANADVENNTLQGAIRFGIGISTDESVGPISMTGSLFRANRVTDAGMAGIFAQLACNNSFVGNNLQGNAGDFGLVFDKTTGANTFTGNANLVVDNGTFDCDGDGVNDPNIISGPGTARHGLQLSRVASGADLQRRIYGVLLK
jgi:hypothetical protein